MSSKKRFSMSVVLGTILSLIAIAGACYGAHRWHSERVGLFVDRRMDCKLEYINIKLDVQMTQDQRELAYRIYLQRVEEREAAKK